MEARSCDNGWMGDSAGSKHKGNENRKCNIIVTVECKQDDARALHRLDFNLTLYCAYILQ